MLTIDKRAEGQRERQVLTGMVVSDQVLARVAAVWKEPLFASKWHNTVGSLCVKYFRKYGKAPGKIIEPLFASWTRKQHRDAETVKMGEEFLSGLSGEYEARAKDINPDYLIDQAAEVFNTIRFSDLAEGLRDSVDGGDLEQADSLVSNFSKVGMGVGAATDPFADEGEMEAAFAARPKSIITYLGALGGFFGDTLARDSLVAFMGPEKSSKTFWLIDMAMTALSQKRRVAFFEAGDMSKEQLEHRMYSYVAKHPFRSNDGLEGKWPCIVNWPTFVSPPDRFGEPAKVDFDTRTFEAPLTFEQTRKACARMARKLGGTKFRLASYPNSTVNVDRIRADLQGYEHEGWGTPDVVVIDYADILAPPPGRMEPRDQTNTTWKQLRRLSQEYHCLVITATQANASSYRREAPLDRSSFSEDKRKLAHANGVLGINVTATEKELGLCRLNWVVLREAAFSPRKVVHVAGCLALARPAVVSTF